MFAQIISHGVFSEILGPILFLGLIAAALLIMFGHPSGKRLMINVIVIAMLFPLVLGLLNAWISDLFSSIGHSSFSSGVSTLFWILFFFLFVIALIRFINHRRQLNKWFGEKPTSQKRRVERE